MQGGVDATAKHFPGLGRVVGNTDFTAGVVDSITTADDPYLAPFKTASIAPG
jgi:beta-N-acetylhexosaminidase